MSAFTLRKSTLRGGDLLRGVAATAEQMIWISPSNVQTKLDGTDIYYYLALEGRMGIFSTPQQFIEMQIPLQHGMKLQRVLAGVNDIRVPVLIKATSEANFATAYRYLRAQMNPLAGDGLLRYVAYDGTVRQTTCRLYSGLEGDESAGNRGPGWIQAPLIFHADDPFWYDVAYTTNTYTSFGGQTITNSGDVECWPKWTINGPITSLTITNTTTGAAITITLTMLSTDVLVIDTTPNVKTVLLNGVTNEYSTISSTSSLWSLIQGANALTFTIAGNTGATSIQLAYKQRYLGV